MGGPVFNATVVGNGSPGVQGISPNGNGMVGRSGAAIPTVSNPNGYGVVGVSNNSGGVHGASDTAPGVDGRSGSGIGVRGRSSTSGFGVQGRSQSGAGVQGRSGSGTGVQGFSNSATGVEGNSATGRGVLGISDSGAGVQGVSTSRIGVDGWSSGRFFPGVRGLSFDNNGNGVYGSVGSVGHSGPESIGVAGDNRNNDGTGVQGRSFSSGRGVYGISTSGVGVLAHTTSGIAVDGISESGIAVYGHRKVKYDPNKPNSVAGYFDGGIKVVNGDKHFQIDHPLDPQNKYLVHTCVESSERKNVYDGVARLDKEGAAWAELPEWFEALNGDFRYQLTAVGGSAPGLHVAEEVSENRFKIAGGKEGMKVCWQITGSRKDPWAAANPFEVEQQKPEEERGRYLEPSLYDAPEEQRVMIGPLAEPVEEAQRPPEPSDIDLARLEEEHRRRLDEVRRQEEEDRRETEELRRQLERQEEAEPEST
jgi:hypothetical protein